MEQNMRDSNHCLKLLFSYFFFVLVSLSTAQDAITDPLEVRALNAIFRKWDVQLPKDATWNLTEPCRGSAVDASIIEDEQNNPGLKCNCSFNANTTCHITHLRVEKLDRQGEIPEEITALKHLTVLKILENYFTGTLPAFLGNMTELQYLDIGHNAFHGTLPKELGNLKNLIMLAVGSNNFSGSLPPEIGNLSNLELIYIDSSGIGGEIPSTFAKLQKVRVIKALDTPISGRIPDFIGNWTRLTNLTFQGNSLQGPIPSGFSQLRSLESLIIGDLSEGNSTLDFIKDFKNMSELILRNARISGPIPDSIAKLGALRKLDLSFNNLTGTIPSSLFNMSYLTFLFLGNNSLTGIVPEEWSGNLVNIDLSYNYLSGRLPRWVNSFSQMNLVANNFIFDDSNRTIISGLDCLQRNFPCNRNTSLGTSFAIKCGGPRLVGKDDVVYEAENGFNLGSAQFHLSGTQKWAVSKVGMYADKRGDLDIEDNDLAAVANNTLGRDFFQSARMSPGSLRYYGFGLENGPYTVTLHFAEIGFPNRNTNKWASLAKRVFDIYVQGVRMEKDFDISKEAGGVERAISVNFPANVSENYLEIHLFWDGKGTCCIPKDGYYGPLIAGLKAVADFKSKSEGNKNDKTGLIVGVVIPVVVVGLVLLLIALYMRRKSAREDEEDLLGMARRPDTFSYAELRSATGDFSALNKLGEGGFGEVYKGTLSDGKVVAVKQLSVSSNQGKEQFVSEIATISVVQHCNLVKLFGCCIEGNRRILVYEYLKNRSLDQALFGKSKLHLDWPSRFNVCLGTARGLAYLHEESRPRIVHRDVKASNILLDESLCPKISDFGLAKLYDDKKTHMSTRVAGTIGYLAPEYALRGHLTEKADIFGFGIVALEVISGRPNFYTKDNERIYLIDRAWSLHESNESLEMMDPTLEDFDEEEAMRLIRVAFLCTQASPGMRPAMSRIVGMLMGDIEIDGAVSKPSYLTELEFNDTSSIGFTTGTTMDTSSSMSKDSGIFFSASR